MLVCHLVRYGDFGIGDTQLISVLQLNQYELLCSFATLCIKGYKRMSASTHMAIDHSDGDSIYFASHI